MVKIRVGLTKIIIMLKMIQFKNYAGKLKTSAECTGEPANQQLKVSAVTVGRVNSVVVSAV